MEKKTYNAPVTLVMVMTQQVSLLSNSNPSSGPSATFMSAPGVRESASRTVSDEDLEWESWDE